MQNLMSGNERRSLKCLKQSIQGLTTVSCSTLSLHPVISKLLSNDKTFLLKLIEIK